MKETLAVGKNGAIHILAPGKRPQVLSYAQIRLLAAFGTRYPLGLSAGEIQSILWDVPTKREGRAGPLSPSKRASQSRSLRRLQELGLLEDVEGFSTHQLTESGFRFMTWLIQDWGGWQRYVERFPVGTLTDRGLYA